MVAPFTVGGICLGDPDAVLQEMTGAVSKGLHPVKPWTISAWPEWTALEPGDLHAWVSGATRHPSPLGILPSKRMFWWKETLPRVAEIDSNQGGSRN